MDEKSAQSDTWTSFVEGVQRAVTRQQYLTWFRSMRQRRMEPDLIEIQVANSFLRDWIREYYLDVLKKAAHEATGHHPEVRISVSEEPIAAPPNAPAGGAAGPRSAATPRHPSSTARSPSGDPPASIPPLSTPQLSSQPFRRTGRRKSPSRPHLNDIRYQLFGHPRYRYFQSDVLLNERYVFDNFITGPSNQLAHAASIAVGNNPAQAYNPLFLHGSVGLGKTHLLQGICARVLSLRPDSKIIYLSCETFVNQFISAVEAGDLQDFRYRYRHADMLLIDDIHFLARKERTQEEFFHTFNTLYNLQKQIVLSCDSPPSEIPTLEDRLVSRFKWGLVAEIEQPDHETRVAIVRTKAEGRGVKIPDDVSQLIADTIATNVRELEGAVVRVMGYASLSGKPITLEVAEEALRDAIRPKERKISIDSIVKVASEHFGVKVSEILGKRRHKSISLPRQVCMYLARRVTDYSLVEIGARIGGRDHTTVIYANEKIARELERQPRLKEDLELIMRRLRSG